MFFYPENQFGAGQKPDSGSLYVNRAREYIEEHYSDPSLRISAIAESLHLSHPYLCRLFRRYTGSSADEYLTDFRLSVARRLLTESTYPVGEIAFLCGYSAPFISQKCINGSTVSCRFSLARGKMMRMARPHNSPFASLSTIVE